MIVLNKLGHLPPSENLVQMLTERGLPVLVAVYGPPREDPPVAHSGYHRRRFTPGWIARLPRRLQGGGYWLAALAGVLLATWREGRPSLVISTGLGPQGLALALARTAGVRFAAQVHEVEDGKTLSGFNRLLFRREGAALRAAAATIFPGTARAAIYGERYGLAPPLVAFNCPRRRPPPDRAAARAALGIPAAATVLLYLGGVSDDNVLLETVEALALMPPASRPLFLVVGWSTPEFAAALRAHADVHGVAASVRVMAETRDKWTVLAAADAGHCLYRPNHPRRLYGATASNKLLESLAVGAPVLVPDLPNFNDFLAEYPVGVSCALTPAEIAAALTALICDPSRLAAWRQAALALHASTLNFEHQIAPVLARLEALAAARG